MITEQELQARLFNAENAAAEFKKQRDRLLEALKEFVCLATDETMPTREAIEPAIAAISAVTLEDLK